MLREALKNIPHELEDLYERALSKVRPVYAAEAHILLHIVLSSLSPFHTQELFDCVSFLLAGMVYPQNPEAQASRLASRTGGLLEVVNNNRSSVVQFIHRTAKEYIRKHGCRLSLKYMDRPFGRRSADSKRFGRFPQTRPITGDPFRNMEGPEFLLLCALWKPSISTSIIPHLFTYAKEVDNKLFQVAQNKEAMALDVLSSLLDNKSLWATSSTYTLLKSSANYIEPSRVELAIAANWTNMIRQFYKCEDGFTKSALLAAVGPSFLDNRTDRVGMIKALIDGYQRPDQTSHDPFWIRGRASWPPLQLADQLSQAVQAPYLEEILNSVHAEFHNIVSKTTLLTALISIKHHPLVSEPKRVEIAALLLEAGARADVHRAGIIVRLGGQNVCFRSALSLCLHLGSVGWVGMFLERIPQLGYTSIDDLEYLAHCFASTRGFSNLDLRAAFLREVFGKDEKEVRPIPKDEEEGLLGVGWPLVRFGSQCGIVGFPHINRGFCSSGDH